MFATRVLLLRDADMTATAIIRYDSEVMVLDFQQFLRKMVAPHLDRYKVVEIAHVVAEQNDEYWGLLNPWRRLLDADDFTDGRVLLAFDRLYNFGLHEELEWEEWN